MNTFIWSHGTTALCHNQEGNRNNSVYLMTISFLFSLYISLFLAFFPIAQFHMASDEQVICWGASKGLTYEFSISQSLLQINITVNYFLCHTEPNFQGYLIYSLLFPSTSSQTFAFRSPTDFRKSSASDLTWNECALETETQQRHNNRHTQKL